MQIRHLVTYSGGLVSCAAARRTIERHGRGGVVLLFADTIIEDEDLYRFLVESAASLLGADDRDAVADLASRALDLPPVESDRMDERKRLLAGLRRDAIRIIPGLAWIADGRTPWEVFEAERYIGWSGADPCSKILKRQLMDRWRDDYCDPRETTLVFGLDWGERHRVGRHRARMAASGWRAEYPMDERPYLLKEEISDGLRAIGIEPPRLYGLGFPHNNCGGFCCKMGHGQARHLLRMMPGRYGWHEGQESAAMAAIGPTAIPMLRARGGGERRGVALRDFRRRGESYPLFGDDGVGWGCGGGCAIDDPESDAGDARGAPGPAVVPGDSPAVPVPSHNGVNPMKKKKKGGKK